MLDEATQAAVPTRETDRVLRFELGGRAYGMPLDTICGVAHCSALHPVPGAPPVVLGLTEWRGSLLTVLNLPVMLEQPVEQGPACLILLAEPLEHTALFLPDRVELVETLEGPDPSGRLRVEGGFLEPVDPEALLRPLEAELRGL